MTTSLPPERKGLPGRHAGRPIGKNAGMPRAIWSGSISFGLVNVPVKLVTATSSKDVRFHQLHKSDHARILQRRVCSADGEEVPYDEIVKGYDLGGGRYVVVDPAELAALDPEGTRAVEIEEFVDLEAIDPLYFEHSYYLVPEDRAAKPYALLAEAMSRTNKVALGRFVLRTKQYWTTLRARDGVLVLATMLYEDELVDPGSLEVPSSESVAPSEREVAMATQLIESLSGSFDPGRYRDEYRDKVLALIDAKAGGGTVAEPVAASRPAPVVDLMAALEASVAAVREQAGARTASA
jgi:DNA end-binding protein Ku